MPEFLELVLYVNSIEKYHRLPLLFGASPVFKYLCGWHISSSHHHHSFWGSCEEWFLRTLCLLLLFTSAASMAVTSWDGTTLRGITGKPKWENPCKIPGHVFDSSTDLTNTPPFELDYLYRNVKGAARSSRLHANASKIDFLNATFKDPDFNEATLIHRQNWLPTLPPLREPYFRSLTKEEAFKKSYELMQYFMVGIEQIIMDQVIHGGQFVSMFRKVENYLTQVLCELQYGLVFLRIPTSPDVTRDVMSQEYRDIAGRASRNLRDYLILRDYVEAAEFVEQLFTYLLERTLKENN